MLETAEQTLADVQSVHAATMQRLQEQHEMHVQSLKDEHEQAMSALREQERNDRAALREQMASDVQEMRTALADTRNELTLAKREHERFRQHVWEVTAREAREREWCSEVDEYLREVGLPGLEVSWLVTVPVSGLVHVHVTARNESEAREQAEDLWAEVLCDQGPEEVLRTDGYRSSWDAEVSE